MRFMTLTNSTQNTPFQWQCGVERHREGHRPQPIRMLHRYPPIFISYIGFSRPAFCRSWLFPGANTWVLSRRERVLIRRNGGGVGRVPPFPQGRANLPKCRSHGVCEAIQ
jgi:hypothetical protein